MEEILVGIVGVIVLGILAQWIAWRFRLPSILLLLVFGFLAGPITGLLPRGSLEGNWVYAFVSVSIGVILFEGGLSLRLSELREVGAAVLNLVTIGVLITWALAGFSAFLVLGMDPGLAILLGAILTVTGPTVVVPLLRHVRPTGRVGAIAKWEGITIDPVGAILAVLVLETILLVHQTVAGGEGASVEAVVLHALEGLLLTIATSVGVSVIGAGILIFMLHRRLVPDYLQSALALAIVVGTFGLSNTLQEESGLLEATLLGIMMANQKWVRVRRISEFKEDLQVLLIGTLFIVLAARLDVSALDFMLEPTAIAFLAILILIVRPVAVLLSTIGTRLNWGEKLFLSWLAPRGVVAAAVASLFAYRLSPIYEQAEAVVPIVFLVIVGTVAIYGLTVSPLARRLGLAHPNPQGVLFLGASLWIQRMAKAVSELGFPVMLIDSNAENVQEARQRGLDAVVGDALSETVVDDVDLGGIGRFLALTPNDEVNSLACLNFSEIFDTGEIFQLAPRSDDGQAEGDSGRLLPQHLRGNPLFGETTSFSWLDERFASGGEIRTFELTNELPYEDLKERYGGDLVLLFVARADQLEIGSPEGLTTPASGDRVVVFLPPYARERDFEDQSEFDQLVANALVIDLEEPVPFETLAERGSSMFAQRLPVTARTLMSGFIEGARYGAMPVAEGVALPHYRLPNIEEPELLLVRCKEGLRIRTADVSEEAYTDLSMPVYAMIFLVSPQEHPGHHLRILASLAARIDDENFIPSWRSAETEQEMKETLLDPERFLFVSVADAPDRSPFIGLKVKELGIPSDSAVSLIERSGSLIVPTPETVVASGDRLTITGDPAAIRQLQQSGEPPGSTTTGESASGVSDAD